MTIVTGGICGIVAFALTNSRSVRFNIQTNACFDARRTSQGLVAYLLIGANILMQGNQTLCDAVANISYCCNFTLSQGRSWSLRGLQAPHVWCQKGLLCRDSSRRVAFAFGYTPLIVGKFCSTYFIVKYVTCSSVCELSDSALIFCAVVSCHEV